MKFQQRTGKPSINTSIYLSRIFNSLFRYTKLTCCRKNYWSSFAGNNYLAQMQGNAAPSSIALEGGGSESIPGA